MKNCNVFCLVCVVQIMILLLATSRIQKCHAATSAKPSSRDVSAEAYLQKNFSKAPIFMGYRARFVPVNAKLPPYMQDMQKKWQDMQSSYDDSVYAFENTVMSPRNAHIWKSFYKKLKKAHGLDVLRGINGFMNKVPSKDDKVFYGKEEYWATPREFLSKWGGDCEDYTFAKYFGLKYFKWPVDTLWILLVHDLVHKMDHAVLAVRFDEKTYILDNLAKPQHKLIDEAMYKNKAMPLFALSKSGLWVFEEGFIKRFKKKEDTESKPKDAPKEGVSAGASKNPAAATPVAKPLAVPEGVSSHK